MATIAILKRTRALVTDEWGIWEFTNDTAPYTDSDTVQYKVDSNINITDVTNSSSVSQGVGNGTGVFDILMNASTLYLEDQYQNKRILGTDYARVILGALQNAMNLSIQFVFKEEQTELQLAKMREELALMYDTHNDKVELSKQQTLKVNEERKALIQSVIDNRRIKALDSLSDTYGTFGAGGLTMSDAMWEVYYNLVADLISELNDYIGAWDASTNTPDISATTGAVPGDFYSVSVTGTTPLDGTSSWTAGDIVVYTSGINGDDTNGYWKKSRVTLPSSTTVSKV